MNSTGFYIGPSTINTTTSDLESRFDSPSVDSLIRCGPSQGGQPTQSAGGTHTVLQSTSETPQSSSIYGDADMNDISDDGTRDDGFIALGTLLLSRGTPSNGTGLLIIGVHRSSAYPGTIILNALKKGWIRIEELTSTEQQPVSYLRVYALPEDIDRGSRGSLRDFQKTIKWLLDYVDCSDAAWHGRTTTSTAPLTYHDATCHQEESLFYIFNTLRSPAPSLQTTTVSGYGYHVMSDVLQDDIVGLKTQLYPYQRRSVAAMAQRESDPNKICDARKRRFRDMLGRNFYLDPLEGVLLKDPPLYTEPQGGILAETMGYGKTLICIALILATRGHYPKVPQGQIDQFKYEPRKKVGSLLAMAARRTKHEGLPWKTEFCSSKNHGFRFDGILNELDKYERVYAEPIFTPTTPGRKGKRESYNVIRLCSATLVIVPTNLLLQWQQEINKHVEDGMLDVLIIDTPTTVIPQWQTLLKYDVVLITKSRFEQEYRDDDLNQGKSRKGEARYRSPLTDIRWLRVICDEGHGFAGSSCRTNAMAMLDKMYIERRWVVSGTPSSTLHGVEVDLSTTVSSSIDIDEELTPSNEAAAAPGRRQSISKALSKRRTPSAYAQEEKDLERLRLIVVNFLRLQPWANQRGSDNANWKKYLSPRLTANGRHSASSSLREVLQTLIIRHRIDDIDCDLQLPALHTKVVYLEPSYHDKLAINMFGLVLVSNFVTSEREDEDYMFHPKNRRKFDLLINNLRQATFHWVGFTEEHVRETLRISSEYLDKNIDLISDEDGILLTEGILNGERALADPSWLAFSKLHEAGVYVEDLPVHARGAWALDGREHEPTLLGTVQARDVQKFVRERVAKRSVDVTSGLAGAGIRAMKIAHDRAEEEQKQNSKMKSTSDEKEAMGAADEPRLRASAASQGTSRAKTKQSTSSKTTHETVKRKRTPYYPSANGHSSTSDTEPQAPYTAILPQTAVVGFTSAKLSYLMNQLLIHSPHSKSIIFYSHPNTAFFIAEALELLRIRHRIYASTLSMAQRNAYLQLFNTDDSIRVLLMDLKQAGQGLHIASANRVYIVAPIWEDGVQSQAIKRAHRIGQTRSVHVETLVLKGTFEEDLIRRRQEIDANPYEAANITTTNNNNTTTITSNTEAGSVQMDLDQDRNPDLDVKQHKPTTRVTQKQKGSSLLDDKHMVQVLKNIKFLKFSNDEETNINARVAGMHVDRGSRMLFSDDIPSTNGTVSNPSSVSATWSDPHSMRLADSSTTQLNMPQWFKSSKATENHPPDAGSLSKRSKVTIVG